MLNRLLLPRHRFVVFCLYSVSVVTILVTFLVFHRLDSSPKAGVDASVHDEPPNAALFPEDSVRMNGLTRDWTSSALPRQPGAILNVSVILLPSSASPPSLGNGDLPLSDESLAFLGLGMGVGRPNRNTASFSSRSSGSSSLTRISPHVVFVGGDDLAMTMSGLLQEDLLIDYSNVVHFSSVAGGAGGGGQMLEKRLVMGGVLSALRLFASSDSSVDHLFCRILSPVSDRTAAFEHFLTSPSLFLPSLPPPFPPASSNIVSIWFAKTQEWVGLSSVEVAIDFLLSQESTGFGVFVVCVPRKLVNEEIRLLAALSSSSAIERSRKNEERDVLVRLNPWRYRGFDEEKNPLLLYTLMKDNFVFLEPFLSFYGGYIGVDHIVLLISVTEKTDMKNLFRRLRTFGGDCILSARRPPGRFECPEIENYRKLKCNNRIPFLRSKLFGTRTRLSVIFHDQMSTHKRTVGEFESMRVTLECHLRAELAVTRPLYSNIKRMDVDEYYFHPEPAVARKRENWDGHLIEFVPKRGRFIASENFRWCVQPYYYRMLGYALQENGDVPAVVLDRIHHGWALQVRENGLHGHSLTLNLSICRRLDSIYANSKLSAEEQSAVFKKSVEHHQDEAIFHFGVLSERYFLHAKHVDQSNTKDGSQNEETEARKRFERFFLTPRWPTFVDNRLQQFFLPWVE